MAEKFMVMTHPDVEGSRTPVSVRAFEKVWKDKGWVEATDEPAPKSAGKSQAKAKTPDVPDTPDTSDTDDTTKPE